MNEKGAIFKHTCHTNLLQKLSNFLHENVCMEEKGRKTKKSPEHRVEKKSLLLLLIDIS